MNDAYFIDETMPDVAEACQDGNRRDGDGNDSNDDEVIPSLIPECASPSPPPFRNLLVLFCKGASSSQHERESEMTRSKSKCVRGNNESAPVHPSLNGLRIQVSSTDVRQKGLKTLKLKVGGWPLMKKKNNKNSVKIIRLLARAAQRNIITGISKYRFKDNIHVYDPLHGDPHDPTMVGAEMTEESHQDSILNYSKWCQVIGSKIPIAHTTMDKNVYGGPYRGMGSSMGVL